VFNFGEQKLDYFLDPDEDSIQVVVFYQICDTASAPSLQMTASLEYKYGSSPSNETKDISIPIGDAAAEDVSLFTDDLFIIISP